MTLEIYKIGIKEKEYDFFCSQLKETMRLNTILSKRLNHLLQLIPKKEEEREKYLVAYNNTRKTEEVKVYMEKSKEIFTIFEIPSYMIDTKCLMPYIIDGQLQEAQREIILRIDTK